MAAIAAPTFCGTGAMDRLSALQENWPAAAGDPMRCASARIRSELDAGSHRS
ncbi:MULTISPECIES: hypothetical protein [Sphingobium]|jgi:hypothetical protein|uniref:hypothetical protein n=1 Tax=Sphingobium TaxID=165695 RepID=UPI0014814D5B|nr:MULTISPECIES: hypothetical protein [Sphingobium]